MANYLSTCVVGSTLEDDEPEEEVASEIEGFIVEKNLDNCFEIHGTLKNQNSKKPNSVKALLKYDTREEFFEHLVESDVIIYDIMEDMNQIEEALWASNMLHEHFQWLEKEKIFILLSSVMTWAKTKTADPDDPEATLSEEDYRRRKPHPNFKEHFDAEKEIMKLSKKHKSKIKMYVIASGILYGEEENIFHDFFKRAWSSSQELVIYDKGTNVIPTIHVKDLAGIIQNIADSKPANKYILAIDDSKNTLEEIVKSISSTLSTGKVQKMVKDQVLVENQVQPNDLEILMVDLRLEPVTIKEEMKIKWLAETGLVENIEIIANEYKKSRNLLPIKVCILGPPGSGKSFYSDKLGHDYQIKTLKIKEVISNYMKRLEDMIAYPAILIEKLEIEKAKQNSAEESVIQTDTGAEQIEEAETKATVASELQEKFLKNMDDNNGRLYDEDLAMIYKETMLSRDCQNHGFILDGFPKTKEQAKLLFAPETEDEENNKNPGFNPVITPQHVFIIKASDKFLEMRNSVLKSIENHDTLYEEFKSQLTDYRSINDNLEAVDEETVLTYFDLREIHPVVLELQKDLSKDGEENRIDILNKIYYELGPPHTYGPSDDEQIMINVKEQESVKRQQLIEKENRKIKEAEMLTIRKHNQTEWNENLELVREQQHQYLETHSLPLRNYLMHLVMPVLTEGLMNCSKVRTEDPIDYLSEFILRCSNRNSAEDKN